MKKYVWFIALASLCMSGIYAEENPFALQENFQKIDKNTDEIIESLRKIYDGKEIKKRPKIIINEASDSEQNITKAETNSTEINSEDMSNLTNKEEMTEENITEEVNVTEELKAEEKKAASDQNTSSKVKKQEQLEQANEEALEEDKVVDSNSTQEEQDANKAADEAFLKATKEVEEGYDKKELAKRLIIVKDKKSIETDKNVDTKETYPESEKVVDIDITKEEIEALKEADEALLKAIQEVD